MDEFWNEVEVARRWGLSHRTLQRWRSEGKGPLYLKLCGRVLYRAVDVLAWEDANLRGPKK
jgi:predicted site-specific integrase-resolvase